MAIRSKNVGGSDVFESGKHIYQKSIFQKSYYNRVSLCCSR